MNEARAGGAAAGRSTRDAERGRGAMTGRIATVAGAALLTAATAAWGAAAASSPSATAAPSATVPTAAAAPRTAAAGEKRGAAAAKKRAGSPQKQASAPAEAPSYAQRPEVAAFAAEVAQRRGLAADWVAAQLAQARRLAQVQRLIMPPPPGTAKNWAAYRARFIEGSRIEAGLRFWREHAPWLERAQARWGVPPEIVVGIIGVETFYGRMTGTFRALDALATLAFDFPPGRRDRSEFFREELEELLVLTAREGVEPGTWRGSFAGALGLPQFMPGSINRWAVDFDGDGHIDLHRSPADAIGSVAHYLAAFGWRSDIPTHYAVAAPVDTRDRATLLGPDILPSFTPAQFAERGAELPPAARGHDGLLALVELQNGSAAPTFVAGTSNFYVVTRYNWSAYYAMAVIELAQEVAAARSRQAAR